MPTIPAYFPPRSRRGSPVATPLVILAALLAPAGDDVCGLCRRRRGLPRVVAPVAPSLAAMVPPGGDRATSVCRRCARSPTVRSLLAKPE